MRPALILAKTRGSDLAVVFITSKQKAGKTIIAVDPTDKNGLKTKSQVICHKLATLDKKIVLGELGTLEENIQKKVDASLRAFLDL